MNKENLISVIVPVYNSETFLVRCLDSILANTYKNIEVICVNDGSTDDSARILDEYAINDKRMKIINKRNGGLSSARNAGLKESKGEFLTFIDSDDWVHPQYFEILENAIVNDGTDAVSCCFRQTDDAEKVKFEKIDSRKKDYKKIVDIHDFLKKPLYKTHRVYACGVLYRSKLIFSPFPDGIKVIEDNLFNTMNVTLYSKITIINLPIYVYYRNPNSIMHTYSCSDAFKGLIWACDLLNAVQPIEVKVKKALIEFVYKRSLFYRYAFTKINQKKEAEKYADICRKQLLNIDMCISVKERIIFRLLMKYPVLYDFYKTAKGDKINAESLFALAELKQPI